MTGHGALTATPEPTPPDRAADDASLATARLVNRLEMHLVATSTSMGGTVLAGATVLWTLWNDFVDLGALAWATALALALARRQWIRVHHLRQVAAGRPPEAAATLRRFRRAFALHGLVWALLPGLLQHPIPAAQQVAMVFMVVAIIGASLIINAFDLTAAACFCLPPLLPVAAFLLVGDDSAVRGLPAIAALFVVMMAHMALRVGRLTEAGVRSRLTADERTSQSLQLAAQAEQARRELADQHALLQQVLHGTQQGFCMLDAEGRLLDLNEALARLLGTGVDRLRGRSLLDALDPAARSAVARALVEVGTGRPARIEQVLTPEQGPARPCLALLTPMLDDAGRWRGTFGLWTDLSGVQMRERERLNSAWALNSMAEAVAVIDADQRCLLSNEAWVRLVGIDDDGGHRLEGTVREAVAVALLQQVERSAACTLGAPDGRTLTVDLRCRPFRDPVHGHPCVVVTLRDITLQARAQSELEASAEYLRRTLNAIGDGVFASDAVSPTEPVRFVNDQLLRLWNIPLEQAATLTPAQILEVSLPQMAQPQRELDRILEIVQGNLSDQSLIHLKDGRVLARRCEPSRSSRGSLRVWTFRDVTAQQRALALLQHRDAEQQALLDAFPGYIARFDAALRLDHANPGLARQLGTAPQALLGLGPDALQPLGLALPPAEELSSVRPGAPMVRELVLGRGDDACHAQVTFAVGTQPVSGAPALFAFGIDIGQRRQAEAALAAARDEAERADRAKGRFLSQLSHELRTPMQAIDGFSQLLQQDPRSPLTSLQRDWMAQIRRGTAHLTELLDRLLDLGRAESGRLPIERVPVDVDALLAECHGLTAALAARRGLDGPVRVDDAASRDRAPHRVTGDRLRLKQVLLNLISNAIKYNRAGGRVELAVLEHGDALTIEVRDTGPGLSPQDQALLFTPFERLDADRRGVAGTGIGLALSRQLVEAMGGTIGVRSTPGVGSVFWVRLPGVGRAAIGGGDAVVAAEAASGPSDGPGTARAAGAREVLVIEPQAVDRTLLELLAEDVAGLSLRFAGDVDEALALMEAQGQAQGEAAPPALILVSLPLPGQTAAALLQRLRAEAHLRAVPVVALLRPDDAAWSEATPEQGFAARLAKPLDAARVLAVLQPALAGPVPAVAAAAVA